MRVVTPAKYELLKQTVVQYAVALASDLGPWGDKQAVAAQLAHHKLTGDRFFETHSEAAPHQRVIITHPARVDEHLIRSPET
jgi:hypothetical protein